MFKLAAALVLALSAFATPVERQGCADVTVIFARGTLEASPIGNIVGPPFRSALGTALSGQSLSFVGVIYPASIAGFEEGGDPNGARTMATDVTNAANSCPDTAIVMSGYRLDLTVLFVFLFPQQCPFVTAKARNSFISPLDNFLLLSKAELMQ
jgi:cutinase